MQLGVLIRLLANVLGMLNEHQRHDRDTYIYINENNIADNNQANLQKLTGFINASVYDYASITHAYSKVFSHSNFCVSQRCVVHSSTNDDQGRPWSQTSQEPCDLYKKLS